MLPTPRDDEPPAEVQSVASEAMKKALAELPPEQQRTWWQQLKEWWPLAGFVLASIVLTMELASGEAYLSQGSTLRRLLPWHHTVTAAEYPLVYWASVGLTALAACWCLKCLVELIRYRQQRER